MLTARRIAATAIFALVAVCPSVEAAEAAAAPPPRPPSRVETAAPITNPCTLLTQAEATEVIGKKLGPGELTHPFTGARCRFIATPSMEELYLDVATPTLFAAYQEMGPTKVPGIGDSALWIHSDVGSYLHIQKGSNYITLGLPKTFTTMTPAVVKAGKLIASRM